MARPVARFQEGAVLGGKFKVVREIGAGGMGAVYEVVHVLTHHHRALKVLHVDREKAHEASVRLLREASAAGRIGNPHIVETFDAGTLDSGDTYVVMELLEGESLASLIKRRNRLPLSELATLIRQACDGLHAAHEVGIVHRDVKPANLFVTKRDGKPFLKIVDFGVSKFDAGTTEDTELTREGAMIGTPSYMSPEQVRGLSDVDGRADVYALGIILYTAASGRRPFGGGSVTELAVQIDRGRYTPLRDVRPELPKEFADAVARAMATERENRFPSAKALSAALAPFTLHDQTQQEGEPTQGQDEAPRLALVTIDRSNEIPSSQGSLAGAGQASFSLPPQPTHGTSESIARVKSASPNSMTWPLVIAVVCVLGAALVVGFKKTDNVKSSPNDTALAASPPPPQNPVVPTIAPNEAVAPTVTPSTSGTALLTNAAGPVAGPRRVAPVAPVVAHPPPSATPVVVAPPPVTPPPPPPTPPAVKPISKNPYAPDRANPY